AGYGVHIFDKGEKFSPRELDQLDALSRRVDGFLASCRLPEQYVKPLLLFGKPMVFFGRSPYSNFPSVGVDGYRAGRSLGELLLRQIHEGVGRDLGHTLLEPRLVVRESTDARQLSASGGLSIASARE